MMAFQQPVAALAIPQPVARPQVPAAPPACKSKRKGEENLFPPGHPLCSAHVSCGKGWVGYSPQLQATSVPTVSAARVLELPMFWDKSCVKRRRGTRAALT